MSETASVARSNTAPTSQTGRRGAVVLWMAVITLLAFLGWGLINSNATRPEAGEEAPGFEMLFYNGYEWDSRPSAELSDLKGKVVVLNFWASWCVECRVEARLLENTWREYRDQDVVLLGITYSDVEPNALEYLREYDVTYPNAPDLGTVISEDYEITGVPETFFIGKDGVISYVHLGPVSEQLVDGQIERLLAQGG